MNAPPARWNAVLRLDEKPIGYWFAENFPRLTKCPCCSKPGVRLRRARMLEPTMWAHALGPDCWLDVCERMPALNPAARRKVQDYLRARPRPLRATAEALGLSAQLLASLRLGKKPHKRNRERVIAAFATVGIAPEEWMIANVRFKRVAYTVVFPRAPGVRVDKLEVPG